MARHENEIATTTDVAGHPEFAGRRTEVPLVQLLNGSGKPYDFVVTGNPRTYADMARPAGLAEIARYADSVGANKGLIVPDPGRLGDLRAEMKLFLELGIDGYFTDHPGIGSAARDAFEVNR